MKRTSVTICLIVLAITGISQPAKYAVHGKYERPVTKEKLAKAGLISDFVDGYPVNWITDYISTDIMTGCSGKNRTVPGTGIVLTADQKNILRAADFGCGVNVNVKYRHTNPVTGKTEIRNADMSLTVIPEKEAEYVGGKEKLKEYFQKTGIDELSDTAAARGEKLKISFTVNEDGKISDVQLTEKCKEETLNQKAMNAIKNMPAWHPAEDAGGRRVKQEFQFRVEDTGC